MSKQTKKQKKLERRQQMEQQKADDHTAQEAANAAATDVIKSYLRVPPNAIGNLENPVWYLHILCRNDDREERGIDCSELENFKFFIEQLNSFFLRSDNATRFNKQIGNETELGDRLSRLNDYFDSLLRSSRVQAELDLIDTEHFGSLSAKRCSEKVWLYKREIRLLQAKNAAFRAAA